MDIHIKSNFIGYRKCIKYNTFLLILYVPFYAIPSSLECKIIFYYSVTAAKLWSQRRPGYYKDDVTARSSCLSIMITEN